MIDLLSNDLGKINLFVILRCTCVYPFIQSFYAEVRLVQNEEINLLRNMVGEGIVQRRGSYV